MPLPVAAASSRSLRDARYGPERPQVVAEHRQIARRLCQRGQERRQERVGQRPPNRLIIFDDWLGRASNGHGQDSREAALRPPRTSSPARTARRPLLFIEWYAGRIRTPTYGSEVSVSSSPPLPPRPVAALAAYLHRVVFIPTLRLFHRFTCSQAVTWRLRRGARVGTTGSGRRGSELPRTWPQSTADDVGSHRARLAER